MSYALSHYQCFSLFLSCNICVYFEFVSLFYSCIVIIVVLVPIVLLIALFSRFGYRFNKHLLSVVYSLTGSRPG